MILMRANIPEGGILALAGSGEYLPGMQAVDRKLLAHLKEPAKVVCLPTGAGTEGIERLRYWMDLGEKHFRALGVESVESLPVFDRVSAEDDNFVAKVQNANFVYLSGGKPNYLMACFQGTRMIDAIKGVMEKSGVVAGCSAGAMIFGERIPNRLMLGDWQPGFGWVENAFIIPHFDEIPFVARFAMTGLMKNLNLIGIEGKTSLICTSEDYRVAGVGGVTIQSGDQKVRFLAESDPITF